MPEPKVLKLNSTAFFVPLQIYFGLLSKVEKKF